MTSFLRNCFVRQSQILWPVGNLAPLNKATKRSEFAVGSPVCHRALVSTVLVWGGGADRAPPEPNNAHQALIAATSAALIFRGWWHQVVAAEVADDVAVLLVVVG